MKQNNNIPLMLVKIINGIKETRIFNHENGTWSVKREPVKRNSKPQVSVKEEMKTSEKQNITSIPKNKEETLDVPDFMKERSRKMRLERERRQNRSKFIL